MLSQLDEDVLIYILELLDVGDILSLRLVRPCLFTYTVALLIIERLVLGFEALRTYLSSQERMAQGAYETCPWG